MKTELRLILAMLGFGACDESASTSGQGGEGTNDCCVTFESSCGACGGEGAGASGAGGEGGEGGEGPCYIEDVAEVGGVEISPLPPQAGQGVCTAEQITELFDDCLTTPADATACMEYLEANAPCARCFGIITEGEPPLTVLPVMQFTVHEEWFFNTAACEALAQNKPSCAQAAANLQFCGVTVCGYCPAFTTTDTCLSDVYHERKACFGPPFDLPEECSALFPDPGLASPECAVDNFEASVENLGSFFCGPPAP